MTSPFFGEFMGTLVLILLGDGVVANVVLKKSKAEGSSWIVITAGYAINPARDLGPRIAHAVLPIAGKGSSEWTYAAVPVIGPLIGGTIAGVLIRVIGI